MIDIKKFFMGLNGKSIVIIGLILSILQLTNFISIDEINPEIERAQVIAALATVIIILIGILFEE